MANEHLKQQQQQHHHWNNNNNRHCDLAYRNRSPDHQIAQARYTQSPLPLRRAQHIYDNSSQQQSPKLSSKRSSGNTSPIGKLKASVTSEPSSTASVHVLFFAFISVVQRFLHQESQYRESFDDELEKHNNQHQGNVCDTNPFFIGGGGSIAITQIPKYQTIRQSNRGDYATDAVRIPLSASTVAAPESGSSPFHGKYSGSPRNGGGVLEEEQQLYNHHANLYPTSSNHQQSPFHNSSSIPVPQQHEQHQRQQQAQLHYYANPNKQQGVNSAVLMRAYHQQQQYENNNSNPTTLNQHPRGAIEDFTENGYTLYGYNGNNSRQQHMHQSRPITQQQRPMSPLMAELRAAGNCYERGSGDAAKMSAMTTDGCGAVTNDEKDMVNNKSDMGKCCFM